VGSKQGWISIHEAARRLGCDENMARTIAENGAMRWIGEGQKIFLRAEDVDDVVRLNGGPATTNSEVRRRLAFLESKTERISEALDIVLRVNSMAASKLDAMEDDTLLLLYENIRGELNAKEWSQPRLLSCCEVYLKISESEIDRLNELTKSKDTWRPFLELCLKQIKYVLSHEEAPYDIKFQRCYELLNTGRKNLRSIAVVFIELCAMAEAATEMLSRLAASDVDSFDIIMKQSKLAK